MRCDYCFYLDRSSLYPATSKHRMSDKVLDEIIKSYMATEQPQYAFAWQGGEPTLMGVDFFRRVVELQKKYGRWGARVTNGLQANATMIDNEFARHLSTYKFLVGVSLDGPAFMHDYYRHFANGRGSHSDAMKGIAFLQRYHVEFNILILVTDANVEKGKEVYRYLRDKGFFYHQYIPCVEFDGNGQPMHFTISPQQWGNFLCEIFDEWIKLDTQQVSVRQFDAIISYLIDNSYSYCQMGKNCCQYFVLEHNGDIYPCDFFVRSELKLGNIKNTSWHDLLHSPVYQNFGKQKKHWSKECINCKYLSYCAGDCLKHRLFYGDRNSEQMSWLCQGYKQFFQHALPRLEMLASILRKDRDHTKNQTNIKSLFIKIGRNEPCPCGSGLKYKKCCGH